MGGPSAEHEVSMLSGRAMLENLDRDRYSVRAIVVSKNDKWLIDGKPVSAVEALKNLDVALLAFHGEYGEDGRMQAFLEHYGLPYSGSGVVASALGMDKLASRSRFRANGLFVPKTTDVAKPEFVDDCSKVRRRIFDLCGRSPWVVKPKSRGSSVGVSIAKTHRDLPRAIRKAFNFENHILVEEYLSGIEVTVPILERRGRSVVLPIIEIRPRKSHFFDFSEKYGGESGAEEIIPARVPKKLLAKTAKVALAAYNLLGCRGYGRVDVILTKRGPYVLEVNTLPGMTPISLFPKAALAVGINFSQLLDIILYNALHKQLRN